MAADEGIARSGTGKAYIAGHELEIPSVMITNHELIAAFWRGMVFVEETIWQISEDHGFHAARHVNHEDQSIRDMADSTALMLIVSELGETLEAIRDGNPLSAKIPSYNGAEEELADAVIRIMDLCHSRGWNLPGAILEKMAYNERRAHMHGRNF